MKLRRLTLTVCTAAMAVAAIAACGKDDGGSAPQDSPAKHYSNADGQEYVFDGSVLPELHVQVVESEWNKLLSYFDEDPNTDKYVFCNARYIKGNDTTRVSGAGLRLRGNSSRVRPESSWGKEHKREDTHWHHFHFTVNFHKFVKDDAHTVHGQKKILLKWFKDDPCYVREIYCFDLFNRYGVWTALKDVYCRVWIRVIGDPAETYYGIYQLMEPVDEHFFKVRKDSLAAHGGDENGNLWKCRWGSSLRTVDDPYNYSDGSDTKNHPYTLKTNLDIYPMAVEQLKEFIRKVNVKEDEVFNEWIAEVTDVHLLLRTIAVSVTVGSWDDYWCNHNNWYLYFDSTDMDSYHFYYIPFDFDYTLGTSGDTYFQKDAALEDPLTWGTVTNPLIYRILKVPEYRDYYVACLKELVDPQNDYFHYDRSLPRIRNWYSVIAPYVMNDTGEDCEIVDKPAQWGTTPQYRLMDTDPSVNFFRVKTRVIDAI